MDKFFKIFGLILLLAATGCEEKQVSDCYDFPANKEDCEAKSQCTYVVVGGNNIIMNDSIFALGLPFYLSWYRLSFPSDIGVCTDKNNKQSGNCDNDECEDINEEKIYYLRISSFYIYGAFLSPPSPKWVTFEELKESVQGGYYANCGNGVIEFGEQCDGSQLGTMSDCATHGSITGAGDWTSGEITCDPEKCYWEYRDCE
ncbi:MAG: hypothetical protein ACQES9_05935 [Myxococcota bacterium]